MDLADKTHRAFTNVALTIALSFWSTVIQPKYSKLLVYSRVPQVQYKEDYLLLGGVVLFFSVQFDTLLHCFKFQKPAGSVYRNR